jgi:hypothetical protein
MKLKLISAGLGIALFCSFTADAQSRSAPHNYDTLIQGLGERQPNAKNLSKSADFQVYKFNKNGVIFFQINDSAGNVLTAVGVSDSQSFIVPIGSLTAGQVIVNRGINAAVTAAATCPCSAQVVYDDATTRIVVIYGANGQVIQVVVIDKRSPPTSEH